MSGTNTSRRIRQATLELAARDGLTYQQAHHLVTARLFQSPQSLWAAGLDKLFNARIDEWQFLVAVSADGSAFAQAWESPESMVAYFPGSKYVYVAAEGTVSGATHARAGAEWTPGFPHLLASQWSWPRQHADAGVTWEQVQQLISDPDSRGLAFRDVFASGQGWMVAVGPREFCDLLADDGVWSGPAAALARACAAALLGELFPSALVAVAVDYGAARYSAAHDGAGAQVRLAVPNDVAGWPEGLVEDVEDELVAWVYNRRAPGPLLVVPHPAGGSVWSYATVDVTWSGADRQLDPDCAEVPVAGVSLIPGRTAHHPLRLWAAAPAPPVPVQAELWGQWFAELTGAQLWDALTAERARRDAWADNPVPSPVSVRTFEVPSDLADWWAGRAERMGRPLLSVLLETFEDLADAATLGARRLPLRLGGAPVAVAVSGTAEQWLWLESRLATCVLLSPAEAFVEVLCVAYGWDPDAARIRSADE